MKRIKCKAIIAAILCVATISSGVIGYADDFINTLSIPNEAVPYYIGISDVAYSLRLGSGGLMTCEGSTYVKDGYKAGLIVELQQDIGYWDTIKSWSKTEWGGADISKKWYVDKGYNYRVQTTHYSYDSNGNLLEVVIKHTPNVYY